MGYILVVGAGLSGAVYARALAEAGLDVRVIDRRSHIGGNCHDEIHAAGVRIHTYGPHLFHTSNQRVVSWLSRFTDWTPYEHRVVARLDDGRVVPMPVNLDTVSAVLGTRLETADDVARALAAAALPRDPVTSAEDHLYSTVGPRITDLLFRPYTKKMWGLDLAEMDASVVRRLQIRTDRESRYFPGDAFQAMPRDGYTAMFERIFDHERIRVDLCTAFERDMLARCDHCFNAMPIDEFFGYALGPLPYRSIRFHTTTEERAAAPAHVTLNYTDDGPYTRETWWHNIPGHDTSGVGPVVRTVEEPCDYLDNGRERYYPVKDSAGVHDELYSRYRSMAKSTTGTSFIGRCGTYQYLDMHQVVSQSLAGAARWLGDEERVRTWATSR